MSTDPHNPQYNSPGALFGGGDPGYANTGAPGTPGAGPADELPDNALSAEVVGLYESTQNRPVPRVGVGLDDTACAGQATEGFSGQTITTTGAGEGSGHQPHPNSMDRPR